MSLAALAITFVFVADDPRLPVLAMELAEKPGGRTAMAAIAPLDGPTLALERRDAVGRSVLPAGAWPIGPTGTSVVPAVDGVIVTIDDAGEWGAAFVAPAADVTGKPAKQSKPPPSPHAWPPPTLPVAGPRALRVFLPAVVDGVPMSASIHGAAGLAVAGHAVAWTRVVDDEGVAVARAELEGAVGVEVAVPRFVAPAGLTPCGTDPVPVQLRQTAGIAGPSLCIGGLEIRGLRGTRHADQPAKDKPVQGLTLRRPATRPTMLTLPTATPPPAPARAR